MATKAKAVRLTKAEEQLFQEYLRKMLDWDIEPRGKADWVATRRAAQARLKGQTAQKKGGGRAPASKKSDKTKVAK
jgi:hypothetical protein